MKSVLGFALLCAQCLCASDYPSAPGKWKYPGLWLKVTDEVAPAGGIAQIQVTLTEPKPIIRTRMYVEFDEAVVDEFLSVSIFSKNGEAQGTASRKGNLLTIEAASPTGELGNSEDLPVFTATVRLRADAAPGSRAAFRILPSSVFLDTANSDWVITDNAPGSVTVEGSLSITDVLPATGVVRAGTPVRILGTGFHPWTTVVLYNAPAMKTRYVSDTELTITMEQDFQMDQQKVEVVNPDLTERAFFPNLRGAEVSGSAYDQLSAIMPMFSHKAWTLANLGLPDALADNGAFAGIALQNPGTDPVVVWMTVGEFAASATLLPGEKLVRSLDELFPGLTAAPGMKLHLESSAPVQMLGLLGDSTGAVVLPLLISGE